MSLPSAVTNLIWKRAMRSPSIVTLLIVMVMAGSNAGADCIDYRNYMPTIGSLDTPGEARGIALSGTVAYLADGPSGLQVIDVSNPASPMILGSVDTPGSASAAAR